MNPTRLIVNQFLISVSAFIFLLFILTTKGYPQGSSKDMNFGYKKLTIIPPTAQQVKVGFFLESIFELDPANGTYSMSFYMWLNWKGNIDPVTDLELSNGIEDWGTTKVAEYEQPIKKSDSSYYQILRIEGKFREPFRFERYPMDEQWPGVTIENSLHTLDELVYVADTSESGYDRELSIPGWDFKKFQMLNLYHKYSTNFGDIDDGNKHSIYSALRFEIHVSRPVDYFLWKLLLPMLIILFASWGALLLDPLRVDSRIILPVTSLLTTVFLQQSYSDALPAVGYLVMLDKIYVLTYIIIIITIMETIYTASIVRNENPDVIKRIKKLDRTIIIFTFSGIMVAIILLVLFNIN